MKKLVLGALISVLALSGAARADERATLKELFRRATSHFNVGKFKEAAAEYEKVYEAHPDPVLLYNIGQAHRLGGDPDKALFFYKSYLRNNANARNRVEVEDRIAELEHLIAEQRRTQHPPNEPAPLGRRPPDGEMAPQSPATTGTIESQPPATNEAVTVKTTGSDQPRPVYKKWWFWTAIGGVVVVGAVVGIAVGVTQGGGGFSPNLPTVGPGQALGVRF